MKCVFCGITILFASAISPGAVLYVPGDFAAIQAAIDASVDGDTIVVQPGTYFELIEFRGKAIALVSECGPDVTIIDGHQAGSVVKFIEGERRGSILDGFTITNGRGTLRPGYNYYFGGGIRCHSSGPTIRNNVIAGNSVMGGYGKGQGGGIYCWYSSPLVAGNTITENEAFHGGGICCAGSRPVIRANDIESNEAFIGGGIALAGSEATVTQNLIAGNTASYCGGGLSSQGDDRAELDSNIIMTNWSQSGGGIYCDCGATPVIVNTVLWGNIGERDGGGITAIEDVELNLMNSVITGNETNGLYGRGGGGIYLGWDAVGDVTHTILFGNQSPTGPEIYLDNENGPSSLSISWCDVEGGQSLAVVESGCTLDWGPGIIDSDPLFVDAAQGDFHLTWNSPCRDAGCPPPPSEVPPEDFEGDQRLVGGRVDIGADEFYFHLYHSGDVSPGGSVDLRIVGRPGMPVLFGHSQTIQDPPQSTAWGDLFLTVPPAWSSKIGTIPASGVLSFPITVASSWASGDEKYFQALVGAPTGPQTRLTNLETLEVE